MSDKIWCDRCGALLFPDHACPPEWLVYEPGNQEEEDASVVMADDAESAAEMFAALQCSRDPDCYGMYEGEAEVQVSKRGSSTWITVTVECTFQPIFSGRLSSQE